MAELDKTKVLVSDLMTITEYIAWLNQPDIVGNAIRYHYGIKPGHPDNIDVVKIGREHFIVFNERAKSFKVGSNYWSRRESWSPNYQKKEKKKPA